MILIDSNILARHLLQDIPDHSERSTNLFRNASRRDVRLFVPATAVAEITWLLIRQKGVPKHAVADALISLLAEPGLMVENERAVFTALSKLRDNGGLSFVDWYHLSLAHDLGMTQVYSFDKKMDRYPGIERIEPE